ncbi:MAG TPA: dienelactone hydrolase family protein [Gammaproteobacteria bacterium]|nr:dienelactone hydrolase family protein [Gammaproteobacteria bacterium]
MLHTQKIEYQDQDVVLEGYCAFHENGPAKKPAVIVAHDWSGRNDFACQKAERLAELGYIGFALDMYGKGVIGKDNAEKTALITPFLNDREKLRQRILSAYETVRKLEYVNTAKIGAIGFCFGGLCVLDLARSDVDVRGVVSFHGLLNAPSGKPHPTRTKMLVLHGHDDPMVPPAQVAAFENEMTEIAADWQVHVYSNSKHAFTNPEAHDAAFGTVYSNLSDKRSWIAMKSFFEEIFNN